MGFLYDEFYWIDGNVMRNYVWELNIMYYGWGFRKKRSFKNINKSLHFETFLNSWDLNILNRFIYKFISNELINSKFFVSFINIYSKTRVLGMNIDNFD